MRLLIGKCKITACSQSHLHNGYYCSQQHFQRSTWNSRPLFNSLLFRYLTRSQSRAKMPNSPDRMQGINLSGKCRWKISRDNSKYASFLLEGNSLRKLTHASVISAKRKRNLQSKVLLSCHANQSMCSCILWRRFPGTKRRAWPISASHVSERECWARSWQARQDQCMRA